MCGITGIVNAKSKKIQRDTITQFNNAIAHRGPDGYDIWLNEEENVALGHRRLSILDLSENGKQPMHYAQGRYTIVFNGEVFNFIEIRKELEHKGYIFHSESDTEVIMAAYHEWKEKMLERFNGMWALALYDNHERTLFLARDRFGIKPLIYTHHCEYFAFASELKAFRHLDGFQPELDEESVQFFLQYPQALEATSRTIFKHCRKLPAGHYGILKSGNLKTFRWWNTSEQLQQVPEKLEEQAEMFRELFDSAVKLRMRSDVPIGSCLSGGFDSTSVVCTLAKFGHNATAERQTTDWQHTFVASIPGSPFDERPLAEKTIAFAGVKGHFMHVVAEDALAEIDKVLYDYDDVSLILPTTIWQIYRELRRANIVVSIDGHGADELMGGYKNANVLPFVDAPSLLLHPMENLQRVREYAHNSRHGNPVLFRRADIAHTILNHHPSLRWYRRLYSSAKQTFTAITKANPTGFLREKKVEFHEDFTPYSDQDILPDHWGDTNRELYAMFHATILPSVLRNFDRLSMAHGIEVRMPFMDWRLVSFVMSLPDTSKIGGGYAKRVARVAMKGRIPEEIRTSKTKIGFNTPMNDWFNGPLTSWTAQAATNLKDSPLADIINTTKLIKHIEQNNRDTSWTSDTAMHTWKYLHVGWLYNSLHS